MTWKHFTSANGLPSNLVSHVNQLPSGPMVFATDAGLTFYDGYDYFTRTVAHGLPDNRIKSTLYDQDQRLIIATGRGIARTEPNPHTIPDTFHTIVWTPSDNDFKIRNIFQSKSGKIYLAGQNAIYHLDKQDSVHVLPFMFDHNNQSRFTRSYTFEEDRNGGILISSSDNNLLYIPPDQAEVHRKTETGLPDQLCIIRQTSDSRYWVGSRDGLYSVTWNADQQQIVHADLVDNSMGIHFNTISRLNDRLFYAGSYGNGLYKLHTEGASLEPIQDRYPQYINHIFHDRSGNRWVGTNHGIVFIPQSPFRNIRTYQGLPELLVTGVTFDRLGQLWVGTQDGLFIRSSGQHTFEKLNEFNRDHIHYMQISDDENWLYIFANQAVYRIHIENFQVEQPASLSPRINVSGGYVDNADTFWLVDYSGRLYRLRPDIQELVEFGESLGVNGSVSGITRGSDGLLWISGSPRFLAWFDESEGAFQQITWDDFTYIPDQNVDLSYLHAGSENDLWVGSTDELYHIDPLNESEIGHIRFAEENERVNWIYNTAHRLWTATNNHLYLLNKNDAGEISGYRRFSTSLGLQSTRFSSGAVYKDENGYLWMGTNTGVSYYLGEDIVNTAHPVQLRYWDTDEYAFDDIQNLELRHDTEELTFSYTTFDYPPEDVVFQTRVRRAGKNPTPHSQWSHPTTANFFTHFIQGPGHYVFEVRASRNSSEWTDPMQIQYVIPRPWWMGNIMIVVYIMLLASAITGLTTRRSGKLRKKNKELAQMVRSRTHHMTQIVQKLEKEITTRREMEKELQENNATKERLMKVLSHDMRSPFQGIIGYTSMLRDEYHAFSDEERLEMINQVIHSTQRAISLLNNMLDWTRLHSGHMSYNPERIQPLQIVKEVTDLLKSLADSKKITIQCHIDPSLTVHADINMLRSILQNLLSNAIKFTSKGGNITLSAEKNADMIEFQVADDGIGMKQEQLDKILDPKSKMSTPGTGDERGSGVGLLLCMELVERHGGSLSATSTHGKGSVFRFTIPASG